MFQNAHIESQITFLRNALALHFMTNFFFQIARSESHGCDVAVKIVSKLLATSSNLNKHLPREIQVIKRLRHPNIIEFLQAIETSHRYIVLHEYKNIHLVKFFLYLLLHYLVTIFMKGIHYYGVRRKREFDRYYPT